MFINSGLHPDKRYFKNCISIIQILPAEWHGLPVGKQAAYNLHNKFTFFLFYRKN